ncbi:Bacteriophytochrome cph2 [Chromobacterium violaceum]|nr:Bacteriophytochrome cph2 [Chromobacterium violaceum]
MKNMGLRLSIDDFGTGYSSLSYLKRFKADKLKIDRSFVRDIPQDADDSAIARAIINMAKNLNMQVVAEGVETMEQWQFLEQEGCDFVQGYLIAKPLPADDFAELLHKDSLLPQS